LDITRYPFLDVMWTFFVVFVWIGWFILLIRIISDVFKRSDIGGGVKAVWTLVILFLPLLGSLIYMVKEGSHLGHRDMDEAMAAQAQMDAATIARAGADGPRVAAEIERAKSLLDAGTIDQAEFQKIKSRALT
jgi:hypothetical protein